MSDGKLDAYLRGLLNHIRDHQHAENVMPQNEMDTKLQTWLQALLNKEPEQKQLPLTETRNQTLEQVKQEKTRDRSLSI
jgi:hypothetical protein